MKTWLQIAALGTIVLVPVAKLSAGAEPDPLTPGDAEIVAQINIRSLLQTPLVKKHALDSLKSALHRNKEVRQLLEAVGLDPLKDIDTVAVSASGNSLSGGKTKMQVVIRGNFAPDKTWAAAEQYAQKHPARLKSIKVGDVSMWEIPGHNKPFYATVASRDTLVMATTKEETAAIVHRRGQKRQQPSKAMQAALAHLRGNEGAWMAMVATDAIQRLLKADPRSKDIAGALQSITGAVELSNDARFGLVVHTSDPKAAAQIKSQLEEVMPVLAMLGASEDQNAQLAKEVIDSIKLKTEANDVSIRLLLTDAQLEKVGKKQR